MSKKDKLIIALMAISLTLLPRQLAVFVFLASVIMIYADITK